MQEIQKIDIEYDFLKMPFTSPPVIPERHAFRKSKKRAIASYSFQLLPVPNVIAMATKDMVTSISKREFAELFYLYPLCQSHNGTCE